VDLSWRQTRIAKNETSFREINERLKRGLQRVRHTPELLEFVCECGDRTCEALVSLSFQEYEAVRRDSRRFAVVPGHVFAETERVVDGNDRYEVVEKFGAAVPVADAGDGRTPGARGQRDDDATP
jgi:hypothetical protein